MTARRDPAPTGARRPVGTAPTNTTRTDFAFASTSGIAPTDEATVRIQKILSAAYGIGSLLFGALTLGPIQQQTGEFALWWTMMAVTFTFVVPAAAAASAPWASRDILRILAAIAAVGYGVSVLTLWPALAGGHLTQTPAMPWLLEITAIGTSAAALAWRPAVVWMYTGAIAVLIVSDRILCGGRALTELAFEDALYTLLFASILSSLVLVTLAAGRSIDRATHSARVEAAAAASLLARQRERSRMEALTHDRVLSTLLTAAHEGQEFRRAAAQQARKALSELNELQHPGSEPAALDPEQFVWLLQGTTTELAADAFFDYELAGGHQTRSSQFSVDQHDEGMRERGPAQHLPPSGVRTGGTASAPPVLGRAVGRALDRSTAPAVDRTTAPALDHATAPRVNRSTAPVDSETVPAADRSTAPALDHATLPALGRAIAPAAEPATARVARAPVPAPPSIRPIPRDVVEAISEALGEALRNSVNHAGKPGGTNRAVHVLVTDHVVRVGVLDDGPGFDAGAVPIRRLGIQISISGRLDQLEGGSALVRSRPGIGTTVMLEWRRP